MSTGFGFVTIKRKSRRHSFFEGDFRDGFFAKLSHDSAREAGFEGEIGERPLWKWPKWSEGHLHTFIYLEKKTKQFVPDLNEVDLKTILKHLIHCIKNI